MSSANFKPKRTAAASRGFRATARLSCPLFGSVDKKLKVRFLRFLPSLYSFLLVSLPSPSPVSEGALPQRAACRGRTRQTMVQNKFNSSPLAVFILLVKLDFVAFISLPSPPLSEWRKYCDARRHAVTLRVSAALVSAGKVMRCIQCCLVFYYVLLFNGQ